MDARNPAHMAKMRSAFAQAMTEVITAVSEPTLCRNAYKGLAAWYCAHYNGVVTPGTEALTAGRCLHCDLAEATWDAISEPPSFLAPDAEL